MMDVLALYILYKFKFKMKKKNVRNTAETVTIVGTGKWILFFVKVGY